MKKKGLRNDLQQSDSPKSIYRNQLFVLQSKTNDWFLYETQH